MKITIELTTPSELEKVLALLQSLGLSAVSIATPAKAKRKPANWETGDKSLDPEALFGLWKDAPRDLPMLREQAWKRNWDAQ